MWNTSSDLDFKMNTNVRSEDTTKVPLPLTSVATCTAANSNRIKGERLAAGLNADAKQEVPDLEYNIPRDNNIPIKLELMHEELDIKTEILSNHEDRPMKDPTEKTTFRCCLCSFKSTWKSNLRSHMKIHTGEKPFNCSVCDYRCIFKHHLQQHMKIHIGEKPFSCNVCQYRCVQKGNLQIHMKIHTGEKPFKCKLCDYRCLLKHSLQRHMKVHTGEKSFGCYVCDYRCILKHHLQRHMKIHTEEKPFKC